MKKINLENLCNNFSNKSKKSVLIGLSVLLINGCGGGGGGSSDTASSSQSSTNDNYISLSECNSNDYLANTLELDFNSNLVLNNNSYPSGLVKTSSDEIDKLYFQIRNHEERPIYDGIIDKSYFSNNLYVFEVESEVFNDCINCPNTQNDEKYKLILHPIQDSQVCIPNQDYSIDNYNSKVVEFEKN